MASKAIHAIRTQLFLWLASWSILILDTGANLAAFMIALRPELIGCNLIWEHQILAFLLMQVFLSGILFISGLYNGEPTTSRIMEIQKLIKVTFSIVVLVTFVDAVTALQVSLRAGALFKYWLILVTLTIPLRLAFRTFQKYLLRSGFGRRRTVILGANQRGIRAEQEILNHDQQGFDVVGFIRGLDDPDIVPPGGMRLLGTEKDINKLILEHQVSDVVLALEKSDHSRVMGAIDRINGSPVSIKIVPDMYEVISGLARTQQIYGLPLIDVNPNLTTFYYRVFKRIIDWIIAVVALVVTSPLFGIIALATKIDSKGPVFYKQTRVGQSNKHFMIYKFRSMVDNAEEGTGPVWAREEDDRITKVGKFLRRYRLDEIPQLINIVKGEMSLIGPRPERPYFVDQLMQQFPFYHRRHKVRPGLSGWSQIKHPYDQDIEDVRQKLKYDFYYIENLSFSLDMLIIISTIFVVFSGEGR